MARRSLRRVGRGDVAPRHRHVPGPFIARLEGSPPIEVHHISGEMCTLQAIDAYEAVRNHPKEWSFHRWPK